MKESKFNKVKCILPRLLIGPDMKRYPCIYKMSIQKDSIDDMENIGKIYICGEYGKCNACDTAVHSIEEIKDE
jgi:hypothetical protein